MSNPTPETSNTEPSSWHALDQRQALVRLESGEQGLSAEQAAARLAIGGPNELPTTPPPTCWAILLRQFRSPLIYVLALAAAVSASIGELTDAGFIVAVLLLNALIGGVQEWRAEKSTRALQKLLRVTATVMRDGEAVEIDAVDLTPGDVVWLESGNRVPADLRLLSARGLQADESLLTGESIVVDKDADWMGAAETTLADRQNMAHAGSVVVRGRAKGVVVATGSATHVGRLAVDVMTGRAGQPPLFVRLSQFSKVVGVTVLAAAVAVGVLGVVLRGESIQTMFLFGVALAVSAIPEGLPVAITVALAVATTRMTRRHVIARELGAVEGLGSCTFIASDKTGTLTCNELTVRLVSTVGGGRYEASGEGFVPQGSVTHNDQPVTPGDRPDLESLARAAILCNEADLHRHDGQWVWRGDPTDVALLTLGAKLGWLREASLDRYPQVDAIPFEPEHRFAASFHRDGDETRVLVKGAPERVTGMCERGTDPAVLADMRDQAEELAAQGFRVLALAEGTAEPTGEPAPAPTLPNELRLLGLVGMIDPLRPGAREAIAACREAGLRVAMVTGDHPVTASAIGRDLGLVNADDRVISANELEQADRDGLDQVIQDARVFARVAPEQKLRLVEAAQRQGHFVAVTGDGVNDAPALRRANIGVAMGRAGTDVAREAADLVVSDDNFASIVAGVEEGRIAYNNVRKVIYLLVSTGAAEVVLVLLAIATGFPLPLLPVQLLWLNLVTNGIQHVALAFEPGEGNELMRPPRPPNERIFNQLMIQRTVIAALVMGVVGFSLFVWCLRAGWSESAARNALLLLMVLFENVHIGNCRSETRSAFTLSPLRSPILLIGVAAALSVHVGAMHLPIAQRILGAEPVSAQTWLILVGLALSVLVVMETHKWAWRRWRRST